MNIREIRDIKKKEVTTSLGKRETITLNKREKGNEELSMNF